ncbi:MAG: hypothetical protein HFF97_01700 [Oscillibacter sp.]|jgi:hypothetical protein|nr:hypothetical protein [Oscillibacter sp.]
MVVVTSCGCVKFFAVFALSSMADTSCANVYVPVKADMLDGLYLAAGFHSALGRTGGTWKG